MKRLLSGQNPRLEIDLNKMFGQRVPNTESFKNRVGQAIIDRIIERTLDKKDKDGKQFRHYSKAYADSLEFKAAGKSKSNPNLRLTGDMLGLMDIVELGNRKITIGWTDATEAAKAHGHITGNPKGPGVKRDFFGLPDNDIKEIASQFNIGSITSPDEARVVSALATLRELFSGES